MVNKKTIQLYSIFRDAQSGRFPLIFVVPGSGQIARYAEKGGAHFLMVLNAGLYRIAGVSSLGSFLPFGNANNQTESLLENQIIPRVKNIPIVSGLMNNDPTESLQKRFQRFKKLEIAGITNWPAVGFIDGKYREALAEEGFTVKSEIEMLVEAKKQGFVTFGFSLSAKDAALMAESDVDALVLNVGWTHESHDICEKGDRIQHAIVKINEMIRAVEATGKNPIYLFFGGSITLPEDSAELYRRTKAHGFGGGSSFERIPVEKVVTNTVKQFRSIPRNSETPSLGHGIGELVGASPAMLKLYRLIKRVAPYDVNVCIEGESGVGKELVATQLHRLSDRSPQPFITLNCGAIPDTLLESEFFGHEKGSFTGAMSRRLGKFELADRGTLFLDEVSELSPKAQVSLLRVIQQKEISRVGGEKAIPVNVRIITTTHQDLKELVDQNKFRADLYFRLNMITLKVPPLRAHPQDIPALVDKLLKELGLQFGKRVLGVTPEYMSRLMRHSWPGNVRELRHSLCRAVLLEDGPVLEGEDFSPELTYQPEEPFKKNLLTMIQPAKETEDTVLLNALKTTGGNKTKAAKLMGISRKTLYSKLRRINS